MIAPATITPALYAGGPLLVVDGELPGPALLEELCAAHAPIIATDGAALRLREYGIRAEVIIGDLDTVGDEAPSFMEEGAVLIRLESQDTNDLEKALAWLRDQEVASVTLIGVSGRAMDHTLNNFSILPRFAHAMRMRLIDSYGVAYIVPDMITLDVLPGDRISLIPLPSALITTSGLAWPLHRERLEIGLREGASNRAVEPRVEIHVHEGLLLVFHGHAS